MIARILSFYRLRRAWTYDAQEETWTRDGWMIQRGNHGWRLSKPGHAPRVFPTMRAAMKDVRP